MADCIINIVFRRKPTEFTIDQKLTLNQLKVFANIFYTDFFEVTNKSDSKLSLIGMAKLTDNQVFEYYADDFSADLNNQWGT